MEGEREGVRERGREGGEGRENERGRERGSGRERWKERGREGDGQEEISEKKLKI